jgi:protein O-GlcNAc transferase
MSLIADELASAVQYQQAGDFVRAEAICRHILRLQPNCARAHNCLGNVLLNQGKLEQAGTHYQQALRCDAGYVLAHNNLGNLLERLGRLDEAAASFRRALQLDPQCAEVHFNLGKLLADQGIHEEAIPCFQEAIRLKPSFVEAHIALGAVFHNQGLAPEAVASFGKALALRPSNLLRVASATCVPAVYQSIAEITYWRERLIDEIRHLHGDQVFLDLTEQTAMNLFYLVYQGLNDREIMRAAAGLYRAPQPTLAASPTKATARTGKIRVGVISSFFKAHTIGYWMRGLVQRLSRKDFFVSVLSVGGHDDAVAAEFRRHADCFIEIPKALPTARRLIAAQQLDVLLYADIGMDPVTYTLAFSRLAPVQCVTLGHPVTTGIDTMDYFISTEELEIEQAQELYTEELIRLKTLPIYFFRPEIPQPLRDRRHFDLPTEGHLYACLQQPFKFHPEFDELLGGILRADPDGILVLTRGVLPQWHELLRKRFAATLPDVLDRIRFLPMLNYADYLNVLALTDALLDTLHFGGGSTSYDAFAVGTPIVTLPTTMLRGRITFALYKQMEILDCVASCKEEYVRIALRLGADSAYRASLRRRILAAHGVIFENDQGIPELEQFFRDAVGSATATLSGHCDFKQQV